METGGHPDRGGCAAVDVHYLRTGGARAAAVLAADAAFAHVLAERTAVVPRVPPYGRASSTRASSRRCARSWTIERAGPAGSRWLRRFGPRRPARPGCTCARRVRHPGDRGGQVPVPHRYPRGAGPARILGTPAVRHRRRDARSRRGGAGPAHGRPVPAARRAAPRRHPRASRSARSQHDRPPARLTHADARNAARACVPRKWGLPRQKRSSCESHLAPGLMSTISPDWHHRDV